MVNYLKKINSKYFLDSIREIAKKSFKSLPASSPSKKEAKLRRKRPVDYLRCAEFPLVLEQMELEKGWKVLDVGSPQWFTLLLAKDNPSVDFFYLNILKDEIDCIKDIAKNLEVKNLHYIVGDVRRTGFPSSFFDHVLSISAIEHIAPENGGDIMALEEIKRILKPQGNFTFSIPLKDKPRTIYIKGPVYERKGKKREFFAREYGFEGIMNLAENTGYEIDKIEFVIEKGGIFALDYWRWGAGKRNFLKFPLLGLLKVLEKFGISFEEKIANNYLYLSKELRRNVICAVITFRKKGKDDL